MPEITQYSMQEVAQRNGKNGAECWVVIKDIVYNFTPYLEDVSYRFNFFLNITKGLRVAIG